MDCRPEGFIVGGSKTLGLSSARYSSFGSAESTDSGSNNLKASSKSIDLRKVATMILAPSDKNEAMERGEDGGAEVSENSFGSKVHADSKLWIEKFAII